MVSVLEEVKRVSLIKETPSDYLLNLFDRKFLCVRDLYFIDYNYWTDTDHVITSDQRWCAFYWIMHHYGFDYDSDEGEDLRIIAMY